MMNFLEAPIGNHRSPSQTNFIIEEDSRSDISDYPGTTNGNDSNSSIIRCNDCWSNRICFKGLIGTLTISVIALTAACSILGVLYYQTFPPFETCKTRQCTRTATLFMKTMDETVEPCDDFHQFACGNWISDTAAVVSVAVYDHTTIMRDRIVGRLRSSGLTENITNEDIETLQQVRIMYNTCIDLAAIEDAGLSPMVQLINKLIRPEFSLAYTLAQIHRETGQDYIFDLSLDPSFKNTSVYLLSIDQPELPVVKANFLYTPAVVAAYERLIEKVLTRLGQEKDFNFISSIVTNDTKILAKKISAFEQLFALSMSDEDDRGKASTANFISLKELNLLFQTGFGFGPGLKFQETEKKYANDSKSTNTNRNSSSESMLEHRQFFNWTEYVTTLFSGLADVEVNDDFLINVADVGYINKVAQLLLITDPEQLKLYIMWELLYTFGKDVTKEVRDLFNAFSAINDGTETTPNRHTECVLLLDQSLPFALTHKYILKYVKDSTISESKEMFRNILRAFKREMKNLDWMDSRTKRKALEKANRVEGFIGYPSWLKDPSSVDEYYAGLHFNNNSFFKNILIMMKWISEKAIREYPGPVDKRWTSDSPAEADAFYDDERNAITFPAGFLQEPFIGMGLKAIDYGALGSVLGHELTHGFDTMGRYSDEYGRLDSWWSLDTLRHFVAKTDCFVQQYGAYWLPELSPAPGPNNTVDGKRTLAENIADNGGIREAFRAYAYFVEKLGRSEPRLPGLEKYSLEQLFFLSFAQSWCSYLSPAALTNMVETNVHSPPKFRIIGPLSNFPEFARVWKCPAKSRMNPDHKCVLWGGGKKDT